MLLALLPAWLVGCRPVADDVVGVPSPVERPAVQTPAALSGSTRAPAASPAPPADQLVQTAIAAAATHMGVLPPQVVLVSVTPREWPDRSLGCPRPGMGYAQSVTPGYVIILEAAGKQIVYHTDDRQVIRCGV
jgi:hypothetical protein